MQVIQPWMFGHGEVKATCLWLNGLMPLRPTRSWRAAARVHLSRRPERWKKRCRTYPGIAAAMADSGVDG